jgi:hypothetical protein
LTAIVAILVGAAILAAPPRPIEIWKEGDTGDVQRLTSGITRAFEQSPNFVLSSGHKPETLYVYVPSKIIMQSIGARVKYFAAIAISQAAPDAPERLSESVNVTCWEDDLAACGRDIIAHAQRFPLNP